MNQVLILWLCVVGVGSAAHLGRDEERDREPVAVDEAGRESPFSAIVAALESGELPLERNARGYLDGVLAALRIDPSSQMLVFSKTSLQSRYITPDVPRAVYFGDRAYVGFTPGAPLLEVSVILDDGRSRFFTLNQTEPDPRLQHERMCVQCHESRLTLDVVGPLVRSVHPDANGFPLQRAKTYLSTDRSPIGERWGGWYVTGKISAEHMGNRIAEEQDGIPRMALRTEAELRDMSGVVDVTRYPTGHSDVVALLVLEHQTRVQNRIVQVGSTVRDALRYQADMDRELGEGSTGQAFVRRRIERAGEDLLRDLLFVGAARLPGEVEGSSGFTEGFSGLGSRDPKGRSLRDFSLRRRLFRYPCSYLIHSSGFRELPGALLDHVYARLLAILSGEDTSEDYEHLTKNMRRAILEILVATHPGLPQAFEDAL